MSVCELVDPTAEPRVYKFVVPNLIETVSGNMVDIGKIEHFTLQQLEEGKALLQSDLAAIEEKIAAIAALGN